MRHVVVVCVVAVILCGCATHGSVSSAPVVFSAQALSSGEFGGAVQSSPAPSFWVTLPFENKVAIVDPATGLLKDVLKFPTVFANMIVSPTQPLLFTWERIPEVQVVFLNTNSVGVVATVPMPADVTGMATSALGDRLYVVAGTQLLVVSVRTRSVVDSITLPSMGSGVTVGGSTGQKVIVTLPGAHEIAIVDTTKNAVTKLVKAGRCIHEGRNDPCEPRDIAMSPAGRYALALSGRNALGFDTFTDKVLAATEVEGRLDRASELAVDPSSDTMWVRVGGFYFSFLSQVSMAPPFNVVNTATTVLLGGAAISPTGVGIASTGSRIVSFPITTGGTVIKVGSPTWSVAYVP